MGSIRIISGRFKGRRIQVPKGTAVRPTPERVREAMFSMLGDLDGMRVVDAYAGSGALGIEALSRGAAHVTFIERDARTRARLQNTLAELAVGPDEHHIHGGAAERVLPTLSGIDLLLCDPPYAEAERIATVLADLLPVLIAKGGALMLECAARDADAVRVAFGASCDVRRYGDTALVRVVRK